MGIVATFGLLGCTSGSVYTATVGFGHSQAENKLGNTDATGWGIGGTVGFSFEDTGLTAVEVCGAGALEFVSSEVDDAKLKVYSNRVPLQLCSKISTAKQ